MGGMKRFLLLITIIIGLTLASCQNPTVTSLPTPPVPSVEPPLPTPTETMPPPTPSAVSPTLTPTVVAAPVRLTATVWEQLPQVPILMYHRFNPRPSAYSTRYTTSLRDFDQHLQALYDAGFSLVSLSDWLRGEINLPEGRRPLIISIDDLFYADQISLDENGDPAPYSGIGRLWAFAQEHPDFNFEAALFYNLGDKGYANHYANGEFTIEAGWRESRAQVIVWGIENGAMPMNHFYEHPYLDQLSPDEIHWQIEENDRALREALALVGREDLGETLPNILALPYVITPDTEEGEQVLYDYTNPEGAPVAAIIFGDYASGPKLFSAPFSPDFNPWHVPRISASNESVAAIIDRVDEIPTSNRCELGEFQGNPHILPEVILGAIRKKVNLGACIEGYYVVQQSVFFVWEDEVIQYNP